MLLALLFSIQAHADRFLVTPKSRPAYRSLRDATLPGVIRARLDALGILVVDADDPQAWRAHPLVAEVEREVVHDLTRSRGQAARPAAAGWNVAAVRAPEVWPRTKGKGARVMILDSGVDTGHPALASALERTRNFVGEGDARDREGHGTHVTGTVLGVAPECKILVGRVCGAGKCKSSAIAAGLDWAVQEKVDVINLSIAGDQLTRAEAFALARAEEARIAVVAAAGNDGVGLIAYPAAVETVLAVGAVDEALHVPNFSQWGPQLSVVAPGVDVFSTMPRGRGRLARAHVDDVEFVARAVDGTPTGAVSGVLADLDRERDVRGKIVLHTAGPAFVVEDVEAAIQRGAAAVLVASDNRDVLIQRLGKRGFEVGIPVVRIAADVSARVATRLSTGTPPRARVTVVASDFGFLNGTSMAAPHATGVTALLKSVHPNLGPAEVRATLRRSADVVDSSVNGRAGFGLIDAARALTETSH